MSALESSAAEAARRVSHCLTHGRDHLNLAGLGLKELPDEFKKLTGLRYLDLTGNQLTALPDEVCLFTELRWLGVNFNQLSYLPPYVGNLNQLQRLYLRENKLVELPVQVAECTGLVELDLRGNRLKTLDGHWANLESLSCLDVQGNPLRALPLSLGGLEKLKTVWLSAEALPTDLRTAWGEGNWERLKLHLLDLDKAEMESFRAKHPDGGTDGLPLAAKPLFQEVMVRAVTFSAYHKAANALLKGVLDRVRNGEVKLEVEQPQPLHTGKLVLIGDTGMGKTCLLRALKGEAFQKDSDSTQGMEVSRMRLRADGSLVRTPDEQMESDITFHCWDMGGQEMYHYTHQIFFSDEAIYLAVIRAGQGKRANVRELRNWLELLRTRTQRVGIRIIMTITECQEKDEIERGALQDDFPSFVFDFIQVDSDGRGRPNDDGHHIPELRRWLAVLAQTTAGFARHWLPNWVSTMEALTAQAARHYLPLAEAWQLCKDNDISDPEHLLATAHEAGLLLWKRHLGAARDYVLLNPDWLSHAVARILVVADAPDKAAEKARKAGTDVVRVIEAAGTQRWTGPVTKEQLHGIWSTQIEKADRIYSTDEMSMLVELMEAYDISYRGQAVRSGEPPDERFLIAPMVADTRPADFATHWPLVIPFGQVEAARFITFELKEGELERKDYQRIICQLIVRLHRLSLGVDDIAQARHWRSGLLIAHNSGARACIIIGTRELEIRVRAGNPQGLLDLILDAIGSGETCVIRLADVVQSVACWDVCQTREIGKGRWPLRVLERREAANEKDFTCDKGNCTRQIVIERLLHPFAPEAAIEQAIHSSSARVEQAVQGVKADTTAIKADTSAITAQLTDWQRLSQLDAAALECLLREQTREIQQHMAQMLLEQCNHFLREMKTPGADGPRLFSIAPVEKMGFFTTSEWTEARFKLTLWCEHSQRPLCLVDGQDSKRGVQEVTFQKPFLQKALPLLKWMVAAGVWAKGAASLTIPEVAGAAAAMGGAVLAELTLMKDLLADLEKSPVLPADHEERALGTGWPAKFAHEDSKEHGIPFREMTAFALEARAKYQSKDRTWAGMEWVNGLWVHPRYKDRLAPPKPNF